MMVRKFIDRLGKATNSKQLVDCTVNFLSAVASSSSSNNAVTSQYNMLLKVAKPRKLKQNTKPIWQRQYIRNKSKEINNILSAALPDSVLRKNVLSNILKKNYNADIYFDKVKNQKVSVVDCMAVRIRGGYGISNNTICGVLKDFVRFQKDNNMLRVKNPLPGRLRAKMGKAEAKGTVPVDYKLLMCSTAKDKTEMCVHNWIKTIPSLCEKLVASCIEQGKFEDSISFSSQVNKIMLGAGTDRGGGDVMNLIRLLNRKDGNSARYSIPLAMVEKATEDYDVLAKTIYNKLAQKIMQPILNDELCMFTFRFVTDVKCLAVRFMRDGKALKVSLSPLFCVALCSIRFYNFSIPFLNKISTTGTAKCTMPTNGL